MNKEPDTEDWLDKEPSTWSMWLIVFIFFLPWLLGMGIVGAILLDWLNIRVW